VAGLEIRTLPRIQNYPKAGTALKVEVAVQDILDRSQSADDALEPFLPRLQHPPQGDNAVTREYHRAQRYRQTAYATAAFLVGQTALPRMTEIHKNQGGLTLPHDLDFDPREYVGDKYATYPEPYQRAIQTAYWLAESAHTTLTAMEDEGHPFHELRKHIDASTKDQYEAVKRWKAGPGQDRWPKEFSPTPEDGRQVFIRSLCVNVQLAVDLLSARAIHHLINRNPDADAKELGRVLVPAIPRLGWLATTSRHTDWAEAQKQEKPLGISPLDGALALLQYPVSKIVQPNEYAASVDGVPAMRDPDFRMHHVIADGPLEKAANCAGDPRASYQDPTDRRNARQFFAEMGLAPECGDRFNFTSVVLAMGASTVKAAILPAYEENRRR
jgi:hypothetical protein